MKKIIAMMIMLFCLSAPTSYAQCPSDILFFGDSHVALGRWAWVFEEPVCKKGISGITARAVSLNMENWIRGYPEIIIVMLGTNDLYRGMMTPYKNLLVEDMIASYAVILDYIERNYPHSIVIVNSLFPPPKWRAGLVPYVIEFNTQLEQLVSQKGCGYIFIDAYSALVGEDGFIRREYGAAHLTSYGYEVWYGLLRDVLTGE